MSDDGSFTFNLRSFQASDLAACQKLYRDGIISGKIAENDSGLDVDDIEAAYMKPQGNHFWVAQTPGGEIVGMIGVMLSDGTGEIRRLRVDERFRRRGIGSGLLEQAVRFCQENNYLKVAIDTFVERESAVKLLEKLHFKHGNTCSYSGKDLLVFYLDLYSSEGKDGEK